ncbi:MAG TPA: L-lactate dehydrogenase [Pyrinomonadaceae bacterium]|nr:L-lactate dehydrogenase [Pyrinomonadaceae bacterium]HMP64383.1 L-lactate dehydrogenase [Pyrinomonadaceae bacterium]
MGNSENRRSDLKRVAVVGCGNVGAASAYALLLTGTADELILLDKDKDRLKGEVADLQHSVPVIRPTKISEGAWESAAQADIVVIAAGAGSVPGESRLDLLERNVKVTREIVDDLMKHGFAGIILMTTNPVDILAQAAQESSGLPVSHVISSGTVLDTARLRSMIGDKLGIDARSVHAYIIGEHGDSEIAAWSSATVGGVPLKSLADGAGIDLEAILDDVRKAAPRIVKTKGYTSVAIASCVARICEAILRDEKTIMPVSTLVKGQYGIDEIYLSLPCVVGRNGVERVMTVPLDDEELEGIKASAYVLGTTLEKLRSLSDDKNGKE